MDRVGSSIMGALSASTHSISRATINDRQPSASTGVQEGPADGLSKRISRRPAEDIETVPVGPDAYPDPFVIRSGYKTDGELAELRKTKKTGKKLVEYHRNQNELIQNLLKPMEDHTHDAQEDEEGARVAVKIAVWASLVANFCLCVLQLYAAGSSVSLSLLATGIDSFFDLGSNVMLFYIHRKAASMDANKWPVGGARLETIGNIVYGSLMAAANLVVIVESVRSIVSHDSNDIDHFHLASLLAVAAALLVKVVLFIYCFTLRNKSSQVRMLWEDHRNDLFVNTFGILMSAGGSRLAWFLDPMGAIIIGAGVIFAWSHTLFEQFALLAGKSAPHEFLQLIIYKAATFSDLIQKVDTVRAYHSGPDYFVEIDIVMAADTPLWEAHDLSQQLQDKIEVLPRVERAFVHVDHETTHTPEHRKAM